MVVVVVEIAEEVTMVMAIWVVAKVMLAWRRWWR